MNWLLNLKDLENSFHLHQKIFTTCQWIGSAYNPTKPSNKFICVNADTFSSSVATLFDHVASLLCAAAVFGKNAAELQLWQESHITGILASNDCYCFCNGLLKFKSNGCITYYLTL